MPASSVSVQTYLKASTTSGTPECEFARQPLALGGPFGQAGVHGVVVPDVLKDMRPVVRLAFHW
eukprot:8034991-Prorocentrum_lima.AAC.1